ncbi:phosphatidylinositol-4- kinase [Dinochytrium kinnereticum]|nr:phosphatidylinositol-4- kinase [Dinochytrium kinnereticum]
MFYNQSKEGYLLDVFADAASAVAASSSIVVQEQLSTLVDVFCPDLNITMGLGGSFLKVQMDPAELPPLIVHDSSHQLGLIGLLDYVLASKGEFRDSLISVCLGELEKFPEMAKFALDAGFFGEEDPEHFESFSFEITSRLLKIAESFPDVREPILRSVWSWMSSMINSVLDDTGVSNKTGCRACLTGLALALSDSPPSIHTADQLNLLESIVTKLLTTPQKIKINATPESTNDAGASQSSTTTYSIYQSTTILAIEVLKIARNFLGCLLDSEVVESGSAKAESLWTELIAGRPVSVGVHDAKYEGLVGAQSYVFAYLLIDGELTTVIDQSFEFLRLYDSASLDALHCEIILTSTEALAVLAKNHAGLSAYVSEKITKLILEPPPVFQNDGDEFFGTVIRNCQADVLAKCLKKAGSSATVKSCLFTITNFLNTCGQRGSSGEKIAANCTIAIKAVAPILKSSQLIEVVIPAMVKTLNESQDAGLKDKIWNSLGIIGASCELDVFKEIFSLAIEGSTPKIAQVGPLLAKNTKLIDAYLEKILTLFLERGAGHIDKDASAQTDLLDLAKTLGEVCNSDIFPVPFMFNEDLLNLFRSFWIFAVVALLKPGNVWPKEWLPSLKAIACRTPVLLLPKDRRNLEADLNSNSVLRAKFSEQTFTKARSNLQNAFQTRAVDTRGLPNNSVVFLLAIYHIERLRVSGSSLADALSYLRDERYYNGDIYPYLEVVVEEVISTYLRGKQLVKSSVRKSIQVLIESCGHRLPKVRSFAAKRLKGFMMSVPGMLWDRRLIFMIIDLVQFLDAKNYSDPLKKALLRERLGFDLAFTDDIDRAEAFNDFKKVAYEVITMALERSGGETSSLLQAYLADLQLNFPELFILEEAYISEFMSKFCLNEGRSVATDVVKSLSVRANYIGEIRGLYKAVSALSAPFALPIKSDYVISILKNDVKSLLAITEPGAFVKAAYPTLYRSAASIVTSARFDEELFHLTCRAPFQVFSVESLATAIPIWNWIISSRPELSGRTFMELFSIWERTILDKKGLYEDKAASRNPFMGKLTYAPSEKLQKDTESCIVHFKWLKFLRRKYREVILRSKDYTRLFGKFMNLAVDGVTQLTPQPMIRETIFLLATLGIQVSEDLEAMGDPSAYLLFTKVVKLALEWFTLPPTLLKSDESPSWLSYFYNIIKPYRSEKKVPVSDLTCLKLCVKSPFSAGKKLEGIDVLSLLVLLIENEMTKSSIWINPLSDKMPDSPSLARERDAKLQRLLPTAWDVNPRVAINIPRRFRDSSTVEIPSFISPTALMSDPDALVSFISSEKPDSDQLRFLMYWDPTPPVTAVTLLTSKSPQQPWALQYAVYVLDYFPIEQVFFYVPQLVQALRYDAAGNFLYLLPSLTYLKGYIELFILKAAKFSQLFAHQIIWNMKANMFRMVKEGKHEEKMVPDSLKPVLDRIIEKIVTTLSGEDQDFYEREFKFFSEVTGISGKLKPFIQKSKAEKKKKIDEEMRLIKVDVGVYLPSNPESIVLDIDYDSGRPLQSHAKAPFMATFKIKRLAEEGKTGKADAKDALSSSKVDTLWQSVIFKVGDDCRQDILALQLISICKSIFITAGLDLYLYPYRIVATDPGCGIIEVIPKSISRDMMGREKVNSLPNYFLEKHGTSDSFAFKKAQDAFIRSLAAYSVILYIVSIKDRHNGNIMFDDQGHILHIDFGFILDIAPGGIEFEASPFKLTTEMIALLGGDVNAAEYKLFSDLVVRSYLAIRPYAEQIVEMVRLMLDSGLPCFKGEGTITKLRDKFQPGKSDRQAADFMLSQIKVAHENQFSRMYDRFQNLQNGIPF